VVVSGGMTMHMDERVYPRAGEFVPERWIAGLTPFDKLPERNAFRSFELGPRACMGRELAMDEMRAILLLTVRWFDFGLAAGPLSKPNKTPRVSFTNLDCLVGDMAFSELSMESKPRGGMQMWVKRTERDL
jgi:cytochrome P450